MSFPRFAPLAVGAAVAGSVLADAGDAHAFTTRLHVMIANKIRVALVASGGSTVPLQWGAYTVTFSDADAKAIRDQPLAFRAGAIGPDNVIFPGMTDPSHAIEQRPFEQCQLLYDAAVNDQERAYAIGCFLHGSTDAIAHHYVNFLTGETFTLNPLTANRASAYSNVVRHITAEAMIQKAAYTAQPADFGTGPMAMAIPKGFVLRTYFDVKSPVWQMASKHPKAKFDAAKAANPNASLATLVASSGLAPAEQLVLAPFYIDEIESSRVKLRADVVASIKVMQDPTSTDGAKLKVTAGADGKLGTYDDKTACTGTCPTLYAKYFTYIGLLLPRKDAVGMELPSAFDKISDKLGADLRRFNPALVDTIDNVSTKLNGPLSATSDGLDISKADVAVAFAPLKNWSSDITTIDYETITRAVVPDWLQDLEALLQTAGVSVQIPDLIAALMQPIVQPIKDAIKTYVIDLAEAEVGKLVDAYKAGYAATKAEFDGRIAAAAPATGSVLTKFFDSGVWAYSFNVATVAIANHEVVMPDANGVGPESFDASHTPAWMQLGACDYLRKAVFPLGIDVKALMSLQTGGVTSAAKLEEDAPIECHDGSLSAFTMTPSSTNCAVTKLDTLMTSKKGSLTRAYPPTFAVAQPKCRNLVVAGLPDPPPPPPQEDAGVVPGTDAGDDAGVVPVDDAGNPISDDGITNPGTPGDTPTEDSGGCGCRTVARHDGQSPLQSAGGGAVFALGAIATWLRRRRTRAVLSGAALAAGGFFTTGCSSAEGGDDPPGTNDAQGEVSADADDDALGDATDDATGDATSSDVTIDPVNDASAPDAAMDTATADTSKPDVMMPDAQSAAGKLLMALGESTWSANITRTEGTASRTRQRELRFSASNLAWGETKNPWGPGRQRTNRVFSVDGDGKTVTSKVLLPGGWEEPELANGTDETFTFEITGSAPRTLKITKGTRVETYTEGAIPKPTSGLTAFVSVFASDGAMNAAFCGTGSFSSIDHGVIWNFARGKSTERPTGTDYMAGAKLTTWVDNSAGDNFAVTNVPGFGTNGGTKLSDQANFIVRYVGTIKQGGGAFKMREADDDVKDGVWAFLGAKAGVALNTGDMFLEVHGKAAADGTANEPVANVTSAGDVAVEIFVLRCAAKIQQIDVQVALGTGAWQLVGNAPSAPQIDPALFPPSL